jgi:uncharacterized SAM-binding protein YcdF (DUF218 family)
VNRREPRRLRRTIRLWLLVLSVLSLSWAGGFYRFAGLIPEPDSVSNEKTQVIVVLTGGVGRVSAGLHLLEQGLGEKLFVSGVYRGVDVQALLRLAQRAPGNLECCIALGYAADSTRGNAEETAEWIRREGVKSVRIVTASYHMPRSLLEFNRILTADIRIVPHPVFPSQFRATDWWRWRGSAQLAISEYHKYLVAQAEMFFI